LDVGFEEVYDPLDETVSFKGSLENLKVFG
jgi:hypothetical protein